MGLVKCPHCGVDTTDKRSFCYYCNRSLTALPVPPAPKAPVPTPARTAAPSTSPRLVARPPEQSLWSRIKEAHRTTVENVAIELLRRNYVALVDMGMELTPERSIEAMTKFVGLANKLSPHFSNWSDTGFLQMAKRISSEARDEQHLDKTSAIAKGLIAVWLECHVRDHPYAKLIKFDLDNHIDANSGRGVSSNRVPVSTTNDWVEFVLGVVSGEREVEVPAYGFSAGDPIRCRDEIAAKAFLKSLRHAGRPVAYQRYREVTAPDGRPLVHFRLSNAAGHIADLYVDTDAGPSGAPQPPEGFTVTR